MPRQPVGPDETKNSDDGGGLKSEVEKIVAGMFIGGLITVISSILGFGIGIIDTIRSSLVSAGSGIAREVGSLATDLIGLVIETPLEATGDVAAGAGIFAPIVSVLIFALVAAMAAAIVYGTWRAIVVIT